MSSTVEVKLADLCHLVSVQVNPQATPGLPYIGLEHVPPGRFCTLATGVASDALSAKFLFQAGDILYGKLRPYLDKAVLADGAGVCTTELLVLRPKAGIDPRYIACVVHSPAFIDHAMSGVTGAHHPRTSWNHISQFILPAHSKDERHGIADLLCRVHALLLICETACDTAMQIKQTAMALLFTRGLRGEAQKETEFGSLPQSWREYPLAEVAVVQTGAAKGRKLDPSATIEMPYLRVANVQDGHLDLREIKTIQIHRDELLRYSLQSGDVVLTEGGDFDKLGRGFIWRGEIDQCVHQNHVFAVRPNPKVLQPEFFAYLAQSQYGKAYFRKVAHKTTNLACINTTKLKAFPVVCPALVEQEEIVAILTAIDHKIALHQQKRAVLEELFKALLHKLMTGEIDVNDLDLQALSAHEPAIEGSPA